MLKQYLDLDFFCVFFIVNFIVALILLYNAQRTIIKDVMHVRYAKIQLYFKANVLKLTLIICPRVPGQEIHRLKSTFQRSPYQHTVRLIFHLVFTMFCTGGS